MPECKLGLNDRVLLEAQGRATKGKAIDLEDIKFHQYVILLSFLFYCQFILLFLGEMMVLYLETTCSCFRCVRLARFENDRTISFVPPDGSFDLMTYRLSTQV